MPATFCFRLDQELKQLLGERADCDRIPLNEYMARVLAEHVERPELGIIPRKSYGRPRKEIHLNGHGKGKRELAGAK